MCFWTHSTRFCLWTEVNIGVQRGSAFRYPRLAKCLETVERETFTPISSNLVTTNPAEIEGSLRIYCPSARDALGVIFLMRPLPLLHLTSPVFSIFLRLLHIVLSEFLFLNVFWQHCVFLAPRNVKLFVVAFLALKKSF